jgi:hypothetical protein
MASIAGEDLVHMDTSDLALLKNWKNISNF